MPSGMRCSRVSVRINHVSVSARDLREAVGFSVDLLGAEPIATRISAERLPADIRARLQRLWDLNPQTDEQMSGRLYVPA